MNRIVNNPAAFEPDLPRGRFRNVVRSGIQSGKFNPEE
jgi:hypothetical protein